MGLDYRISSYQSGLKNTRLLFNFPVSNDLIGMVKMTQDDDTDLIALMEKSTGIKLDDSADC